MTRPGLEHQGQDGTQRWTGLSGGVGPVPRTGTSGAGPRNKRAAPWTEGRGDKKRHKPRLDHQGKNKKARMKAPWTGATGGLRTEAPDGNIRG